MADINIVLTLTFSIVMLMFMIYPSMLITAWIEKQVYIPPKWHNPLVFGIVIVLSLSIGIFLRFL